MLSERFWAQVDKTADCWMWTGYRNNNGYGAYNRRSVHRLVYEHLVGPLIPDMEIDHLCNIRACVNPNHLEQVTISENESRKFDRKKFCNHGHPLTPDNIKYRKHGRCCRRCFNDQRNAWRKQRA